ncbi:RNA-directed DNA polymerase, eukaryota [Artemisia annua]|uniref:RNA-directed DNA polymerase, eukaryota n=1 Tax=Artemisia annua TaxID=35608 RepID=A0A2U1LUB6_ARTAN|nr:RNA-directed DNA polymerase, eukaryota [Artemisia annua]
MTRLEMFRIKSMWGNYTFDYACSLSRGRAGGLISVWDPSFFVKDQIWCDDWYIIVQGKWVNSDEVFFMINIYGPQESSDKIALWNRLLEFIRNHDGHYVIFGDLNEVRVESERYGIEFSRSAANVFNTFIDDARLFKPVLGGRNFTWMNKAGTKMSKLDRFLISQHVMDVFTDVKVTALPRGWSDHTPIMLHCDKVDYGPIPFKFFHSWLQRDGFNDCIKMAYNECSLINPHMPLHQKLKVIKEHIKCWTQQVKNVEIDRKHEIISKINDIETKIDSNIASEVEKEDRIKLLKERDDLQQLEDMDVVQKAKVKWDVEGDENTKIFHGILKQKRHQQMVQGVMIDGTWVTDPNQVKMAFHKFYKDKFDVLDSLMELPPMVPFATLSQEDNIELERPTSKSDVDAY